VLTVDELKRLLEIVKNAVNNQAAVYLQPEIEQHIKTFLGEIISNTCFYQVVLEKPIMELVERIASDRDICEFVLSITTLVSQWMASEDFQHARVIKTIANSLEYSQSNYGELTLLPQQIQDSIRLESGWVDSLLEQNLWLVVLYLYNLASKE